MKLRFFNSSMIGILLVGCCISVVSGQSGFVSAGKDLANSGVQWAFSVGQPFHLYLNAGTASPTFSQGIQQTYQDNKILGTLTYDNTAQTPLNNCQVQLKDNLSNVVTSANSGLSGAYEISQFPDGAYFLTAASTKPWGGVNATDALRVRQHFTGAFPLAGIRMKAADVNATNSINANDALLITRRFSSFVTSFVVGDWCFDNVSIQANGQTQSINLKGLAFGDVNGSFVPSSLRQPVRLALDYFGVATTSSKEDEVWIPVFADSDLQLAALSLVAECPSGINVLDVRTNLPKEDFSWTCKSGELRLGWTFASGYHASAREPLFELKVKGSSTADWQVGELSEIADLTGEPLNMVNLRIPKVLKDIHNISFNLYPNPSDNHTRLEWYLPTLAHSMNFDLFDIRGRKVWSYSISQVPSGPSFLDVPVSCLSEGRYLTRIMVQDSENGMHSPIYIPLIIQR